VFRGKSSHSIDNKGRLVMPARFRDHIKASGSDGVIISTMDNGLFAYTYDKWREIEERVLSLKSVSNEMRRFRRFFIGGAHDCKIDKQNRFLLPPEHRKYAKIEKEILIIGTLDHFEIFSKEISENEDDLREKDLKNEEFSGEIAGLGL